LNVSKLRDEIYRLYRLIPVEQPDTPEIKGATHGTFVRPSEESWVDCRANWQDQLGRAKRWIDVVARHVAEGKPLTQNDVLVIMNCQHIILDFEKALAQGFMEVGEVHRYKVRE